MATETEMPIEQRLKQLLQHLGIQKAHFAASMPDDWKGLINVFHKGILSLTLLDPQGVDPDALRPLESRLLLITGDSGPRVGQAQDAMTKLADSTCVTLSDYFAASWSDIVADRKEEVKAAIEIFLAESEQLNGSGSVDLAEGEGEVAGITYRVRGSGPPLLLFPIGLKPSQWEPIIPNLADKYCTVTLGGAYVGQVRSLEVRARIGYRPQVRNLIAELQLKDGDTILDVGCGSGAHDRYLVHMTGGKNPITAVDHSPYMIGEAIGIARAEGLEGAIKFQEGNAEALPFADNSFDAVMSVTVMEEVNADKMVAELVRVAKPGGRIGVIVRAADMPWLINLPLPAPVKQKVEAPGVLGGGVGEGGCADASLYTRFHRAGLAEIQMLVQFSTLHSGPTFQNWQTQAVAALTPGEAEEWHTAVAQVVEAGTFFVGQPFHCAVGTKP